MLRVIPPLGLGRFPVVNVLLIVANFAVWLFYELPGAAANVAMLLRAAPPEAAPATPAATTAEARTAGADAS